MKTPFDAFMLHKTEEAFHAEIKKLELTDLPESDVLVEVHYSSVNYKDGLASLPKSSIVKNYPFVPGIDLAGMVIESNDPRFKQGDAVLATGFELGVAHYGGYSAYASLSGDWLVHVPEGLTLKEAMIYGTAGFTAALSIDRLEKNGLTPESGKVLVTGATGGVGSVAIAMLQKRGYHVVASTGKDSAHNYLTSIGANEIIGRDQVYEDKVKPLDKQQWAAAIDPVGGQSLASVLSKINYGGAVAVSGLAGGGSVPTTVYPFILRGVTLIGIDSVFCPMSVRKGLWERMSTDLKPVNLHQLCKEEIGIAELPAAFQTILDGQAIGRTVVNIAGQE